MPAGIGFAICESDGSESAHLDHKLQLYTLLRCSCYYPNNLREFR